MRLTGLAVLTASAMALAACGGGESKPEAASTPSTPAAAPAPAAAAGAAGAVAAAPITGKTIEIQMLGDAKGYRYEPSVITAKAGDALKFVVVGPGGPHNVAFDPAAIPAGAEAQLDANFGPDKMGTLMGPLKTAPGESFTLSLGGLPAGKYDFNCTPHLAMGMKGTLTIEP